MRNFTPHLAGDAVKGRARDFIVQTWQSQANLSLFLALLIVTVFILPSIGFGEHDTTLYTDAAYSVLVVSGVAIAWGRRALFIFSMAVGLVALAVRWYVFLRPSASFELWREALTLATIALIAVILLDQVFRPGKVTIMRIQGAIAIYLVFGLMWAHGYRIAAHLNPAAFSSSVGGFHSVSDWVYYSFATLTTLGYGDVVPVSHITRTMAIAEALSGQLYLTVTIARLVAMQVVSWQEGTFRNS